MRGSYLPTIHDFFPRTRRGHGTTHPDPRINKAGVQVRKECLCVQPTCSRFQRQENGKPVRGERHDDAAANVNDWKAERGFHKDTPLEYCR